MILGSCALVGCHCFGNSTAQSEKNDSVVVDSVDSAMIDTITLDSICPD